MGLFGMALRTRNIINGDVVWFGSAGKTDDNKISAENFVQGQQSVVAGLKQRLSVLKGELWYKANFGLPLFDKVKTKALIDAFISSTILSHPDVQEIISFSSTVENKKYLCDVQISTTFGQIHFSM